jgi:Proteasome-substrate-size regulator, mid region
MQCQTGHRLACVLARSVLTTLLRTSPINYYEPSLNEKSAESSGQSPLEQWGKVVVPADVQVEWYTPDDQILALCSAFFEEFISDPLESLDQYANGSLAIDDKKVQKHIHIVEALFTSVSSHCSFDFDEPVALEGVHMAYPKTEHPQAALQHREILLQGKPVRSVLSHLLHRVAERILTGQQDETKSLKSILVIYKAIMLQQGPSSDDVLGLATALCKCLLAPPALGSF